MNPWVAIIAQYGLEFAIELAKIIEAKGDPTSADFIALKTKRLSKDAEDYVTEAPGPAPAPVSPP